MIEEENAAKSYRKFFDVLWKNKAINQRNKKKFKSMAESLGGHLGRKSTGDILKELKDERRKSDRF